MSSRRASRSILHGASRVELAPAGMNGELFTMTVGEPAEPTRLAEPRARRRRPERASRTELSARSSSSLCAAVGRDPDEDGFPELGSEPAVRELSEHGAAALAGSAERDALLRGLALDGSDAPLQRRRDRRRAEPGGGERLELAKLSGRPRTGFVPDRLSPAIYDVAPSVTRRFYATSAPISTSSRALRSTSRSSPAPPMR